MEHRCVAKTNQQKEKNRIETAHLTGPSLFARVSRGEKIELNQFAVMNDCDFCKLCGNT